METNKNTIPVDEAFLDAAATHAVGALTADEADAFKGRLAAANAEERRVARELEDAVARLAAASPYLEPPASLRAGVLQATAPETFKIEQYRKAENMAKWQRWGLVAAILFLMAGAAYNASLQAVVKSRDTLISDMGIVITNQRQELGERNRVLAIMLDPKTVEHPVVRADGAKDLLGKLFVNDGMKASFLVLSSALIQPGASVKIAFDVNGEHKVINVAAVGALGGHTYTSSAGVPSGTPIMITPGKGAPVNATIMP